MPSACRTPPPPDMLHYTSVADQLRTLPITGVIEPGEGGIGRGNDFTTDVLEIPKDEIPMLKIDPFCTEYHLQFCDLLKDNGYYNVNSILEMDDEKELEKFLKGNIHPKFGEDTEALVETASKKGGDGGTGEASQVPLRDVYRFGVIRGGIGGEGGAGGIIRDIAGNAPPADWYIENGTANLYGGEGGIGGFGLGDAKGKAGGIGEGPKVAGANVNFFASIAGGLGGRGGAAMNEGGHGGDGGGRQNCKPPLSH
ncbi:hypothetical protein MSAN_01167000 [Mycena sanguinolenta]|uniref:Uncharacterized protein n=1 Tax=Mycena sanguinolenta TaxID=230812 RepID=A0A8H6YK42_9AGAR|nr:hypothetical protein MSAN_01167000 [Mycena sanguinolenta]